MNDPNLEKEEKVNLMMMMNKLHSQSIDAMEKSLNFKSIGSSEAAAGVMADVMLATTKTPDDTMSIDMFTKGDIYDVLEDMVDQIKILEISSPEQLEKLVLSITTIGAGLIIVSNFSVHFDHIEYRMTISCR